MVKVYNLDGEEKGTKELPETFEENYRPDLIKKAVLSQQSRKRQSYGADKRSGLKTSAHYEGLRDQERNVQMMNREMSRMPREHGDTARMFRGLVVPHAVGGRRAHPPKSEKKFEKKINKKERKKAIRSAVSSTSESDKVSERGHKFDAELPVVLDDGIQNVEETKELKDVLDSIGLGQDLERADSKNVRSGKGTMRGRKYKGRTSVLIVVDEDDGVSRAASNLPGVEVCDVDSLNAELLSPGAHGIRLTVYSESAVDSIGKRWTA